MVLLSCRWSDEEDLDEWGDAKGFWSDDDDANYSDRHRKSNHSKAVKREGGAKTAGRLKPRRDVLVSYNASTRVILCLCTAIRVKPATQECSTMTSCHGSKIKTEWLLDCKTAMPFFVVMIMHSQNMSLQALIRKKIRAPTKGALEQIKIPCPLPLSWGRTVRPYVPPELWPEDQEAGEDHIQEHNQNHGPGSPGSRAFQQESILAMEWSHMPKGFQVCPNTHADKVIYDADCAMYATRCLKLAQELCFE